MLNGVTNNNNNKMVKYRNQKKNKEILSTIGQEKKRKEIKQIQFQQNYNWNQMYVPI